MQEKDHGEWLVGLLCKPLPFFSVFIVIYTLHSTWEFHKLDVTSLMCCVTSVLHFHTVLLFCGMRAQIIMTAIFWSTLDKCVVHTSWNVIRYCSFSFSFISFICQKNTVIQYKSLHQGCCLRKFFGPKEVRSPSNISRCPFKKKNSCNLIKRATTGALKHHWSTGESAKEKCFQCTCTCRFKKRSSSSTL